MRVCVCNNKFVYDCWRQNFETKQSHERKLIPTGQMGDVMKEFACSLWLSDLVGLATTFQIVYLWITTFRSFLKVQLQKTDQQA